LYAPDPIFGGSPTSVTFGIFVNDGVHLVSQNITIGVTPSAEPATLAEAETGLADIQADLEAAIKDKIDALTTDPTAITATTAQFEALMAALLAARTNSPRLRCILRCKSHGCHVLLIAASRQTTIGARGLIRCSRRSVSLPGP
jgi:hypothetical protein